MNDTIMIRGVSHAWCYGCTDECAWGPCPVVDETRDITPERLGVEMADAAYEDVKAQLDDVLKVLDSLTDVTFLLVHQVMKGYKTDDQVTVTRIILEDAMQVLRDHNVAPFGCTECGSRDPNSSPYHANHCRSAT